MNFKNLIKAIKPPLLLALAFALLTVNLRAQVTATTITPALTNTTTVATLAGVTIFAGATNSTVDIRQGRGIAFQFSALATGAGAVTWFISPSVDGTNFATMSECWIWGSTLNASGFIVRATNFPASVTDNYRKIKLLAVTNSAAATINISNAVWSRYP
jgi:hypothetical protein